METNSSSFAIGERLSNVAWIYVCFCRRSLVEIAALLGFRDAAGRKFLRLSDNPLLKIMKGHIIVGNLNHIKPT